MSPVLGADRSYRWELVKTVLAAGNVTSTIPWTSPAAYTTRDSSAVAIGG